MIMMSYYKNGSMMKKVCYGLCAVLLFVMGCNREKTLHDFGNMGEREWKGRVFEKKNSGRSSFRSWILLS